MDFQIALMLTQDGIVNGAIYALMALALVLVFSVTRVIFIPQGEFVTYAALAMAALQTGKLPAVLWLLVALGALTLVVEAVRQARGQEVDWRSTLLWAVVLPAAAAVLMGVVKPQSMLLQALAVLLLVVPMGPLVYRLAYRPLADATVLILLIVSVALHLAMVGLGLYFFGAEGSRTAAFSEARWDVGGLMISGQSVVIVGATAVLVVAMFFFFERTIIGKALRATAINRVGARLMGIPTALSGDLSFALAALIGAVSGLLIAPVTTIYYDTGFLIGLKGFVAAIVGGLHSYPLALLGALLVGQLESFSSFWASAFKEVIVFTLIIPVLWWRSLHTHHVEDEE
ncbi:branched-chain amino acid ABC transporter permease [Ottowia sp.]|uniref:branched-chain amino acid ABC transporter permease n=1 Tax=Ottowia sp. TaxID=1898956 RepID=UPI001DDAE81F|nr:branched-chain amino acid ABC transporter permease [Ottowia sp.]MCB2023336.1 branched-chain amino acid ABC transporter permease [Ottowia sp.]MCP5257665.1 branched-chain amino acid ABC transporter permease [Burkholderiaceae bacterium]HPR42961.1 branched-chain amino acid ABC transporter permease [Ottowia sp.]HRW72399.1 branched-chain amino acid ABC transporter permease [Ottowia sp.]